VENVIVVVLRGEERVPVDAPDLVGEGEAAVVALPQRHESLREEPIAMRGLPRAAGTPIVAAVTLSV